MNQRVIAIISIILGVMLVISLGFLVLFGVRLSDASKVKTAEIAVNLAKQEKKLKADFQKDREITLATYKADEMFGAFSFSYPRVWSTNVIQDKGSKEELVFLSDPNLIVANREVDGPFTALRVLVYSDSYTTRVNDIRSKLVSRIKSPYKEEDATLSGIKGKKYTGLDADSNKNVSFIIIPLRDKALYVGTDDNDKYAANLATILKSFKVSK